MTNDQIKLFREFLPEYIESYTWMLTDIKARSEEIKLDDYSPELTVAIECKRLMDLVTCKLENDNGAQ